MSDDRLLFRKTLNGLAPAEDRAVEWLGKIKLGTTLAVVRPKQPRNPRHHALYWALVNLVWDNLDGERYPTPDDLHAALKVCAGIRTEIVLPSGAVAYIPGSIAFHKMDQAEFGAFYDRVCDLMAKHFLPGVTADELKTEVETMIGVKC